MEAPTLPFTNRAKAVLYSIVLILWWVAIWGIADTVIHLVFKGQTMKELAVYFLIVAGVLSLIYMYPDLLERM